MNSIILRLISAILGGLLVSIVPIYSQIHADLKPYHDRFINEAIARSITLPAAPNKIQFFNNGNTDTHGACFYPDKAVYINKTYWDAATADARETLMFHELAHWYLKSGHVWHVEYDIMNPVSEIPDYSAKQKNYLDILFLKIYETHIDRTDMTLKAGDILITSDTPENPTAHIYILSDATPAKKERSLAIIDSIMQTHKQYDYINNKGWRLMPYDYTGMNPVVKYDTKVSMVWGEMNRMYLHAPNINKAPKLGANSRIRWNEDTEMTLVIDYKNFSLKITHNATIIYYVKKIPTVADGRKEINIQ